VHRTAFAHEAREPLRTSVSRLDPQRHLRLSELRVLARDTHVTGHRQLAAAAQRESVDRRDHRLAARLQAPQHALAALRARLAVERPLPRQITDVGASDERLWPGARENRAADL